MKTTATKAHFAGAGGAVAGAVSTLLAPVIWGDNPPVEQVTALSTVLGFAIAWLATYFAPANQPTA